MCIRDRNNILILALLFFSLLFIGSKYINKTEGLVNINSVVLSEKVTNKEDLFVYIGRDSCQECTKFKPILIETLKKINKDIYYYNTEVEREENEKVMNDLIKILNVKVVPTVIHLKDGTIQDKIVGNHTENKLREFFQN